MGLRVGSPGSWSSTPPVPDDSLCDTIRSYGGGPVDSPVARSHLRPASSPPPGCSVQAGGDPSPSSTSVTCQSPSPMAVVSEIPADPTTAAPTWLPQHLFPGPMPQSTNRTLCLHSVPWLPCPSFILTLCTQSLENTSQTLWGWVQAPLNKTPAHPHSCFSFVWGTQST